MKTFEVPYNFQPDFITRFKEHPQLCEAIECVYLPAWHEDAETTRQDTNLVYEYPKTYQDWKSHVLRLKDEGMNPCILIQKCKDTFNVVEKYYEFGVRKFIINDDEAGRKLKGIHGNDIELILSITRVLSFEELCNEANDFSMYHHIVLFFYFNRHFDLIKQLPKKYKYSIIVNEHCFYNCKLHDEHWYMKFKDNNDFEVKDIQMKLKCHACQLRTNEYAVDQDAYTTYIDPHALGLIDDYIYCYKLVDRRMPTEIILYEVKRYAYHDNYYNVDDEKVKEQQMLLGGMEDAIINTI